MHRVRNDRFHPSLWIGMTALCIAAGAVAAAAEETAPAPSATPETAAPAPPSTAPAPAALPAQSTPATAPEAAAPAQPSAAPAPAAPAPAATAVGDNTVVKMEYQLQTDDGAVVDSTEGKAPFEYTQGRGQIIPGLERQLTGLHVGDSRAITVKPEEAYGPVNPAAVEEINRSQLPKELEPQVGMVLRGADPEGRVFRATIKEVKPTTVVLDLNHPLAGKTLRFQVKILDVHPAPATP